MIFLIIKIYIFFLKMIFFDIYNICLIHNCFIVNTKDKIFFAQVIQFNNVKIVIIILRYV